ncbi:hypothetical protein Afil01_24030 [Actinorhabdospora filicis]|uniref:Zn-dependent metalloprotease n=1 Tax=Actinorhabdospora filicis TaxID=1785913 RepID=A0A9W6SKU9_9ACTN|nr:M28 family peptidase [Actinorhabdospora filicis]GLZ77596.1 hypothetical protein Afil01_24030 [Actinorhabdospora filicis]
MRSRLAIPVTLLLAAATLVAPGAAGASGAASGQGNGYWNGPPPFSIDTSTDSTGAHVLSDPVRTGISCSPYPSGTFDGSDDVWGDGGTGKETGCADAMYVAQRQWDMLRDWLGRNGFDGNGRGIPMAVGLESPGISYDGNRMLIGHDNTGHWVSKMDILGHEFGHVIEQTTPGGAATEAGLSESTGDIFGALLETYANQPAPFDTPDYTVGEGPNASPLRYMYNPSLAGDPNCWSAAIPGTETHQAAGVMNHWFYLLAEGSRPGGKPASPTCDNSTVSGVGIQNAGKIFYYAMLRKTSGMTHAKYRAATLSAARDLDASCSLYRAAKAAWNAVAVPPTTGEAVCDGSGFEIFTDPSSGTAQPGQNLTVTVHTSSVGMEQRVDLSATSPIGISTSFSPSTVMSGQNATMTVSVGSGVTPGNYQVTVTGRGQTATKTAVFSLAVAANPDVPDVDVNKVTADLAALQKIAQDNGGNRRAGSAGYTASVAYVKQKLLAAGFTVTEQKCATCRNQAPNLIAEWPKGDANRVLMLGAHLDSVSAGPGVNDNGSGAAALLEVALTMASYNLALTQRVRFAWWSDEESGLVGSRYYVSRLSRTERAKITGYLNFDMVGSTNGGFFINNINTPAAAALKAYWQGRGLLPEENVEGAGRSDDYSFREVGIPTSGYATGASARKTAAQAAKWGGTSGAPFDPCYHQACDRYPSNVATRGLNEAADGMLYAIMRMAM